MTIPPRMPGGRRCKPTTDGVCRVDNPAMGASDGVDSVPDAPSSHNIRVALRLAEREHRTDAVVKR